MNRGLTRQILNVLAAAATIAFNGIANALPLNNLTTGEISDRFQVYFVPAGYVFSIWGLIYLGIIAFAVYQALPAQRSNPRLQRIGYLFVLSCVANIAWLFLWHYQHFLLTLIAMFGLLLCLIALYARLGIGQVVVPPSERWLVHLPFSIYLGWVTVASIANTTIVLDYLRWDGWGLSAEWWALGMLLVGVILALGMALTRRDVAYVLVLIWAYVGIAVKQSAIPIVAQGAWVTAGLLALIALWVLLVKLTRKGSPSTLNETVHRPTG
ncbi:MAG: TspO/MBR family protein [Anaerolineae bacterium]